jgi:cellulase
MKAFTFASLLSVASAHAIFQRLSVNGADQGLLNGVRSTNSNNPIENVNSGDIACNSNFRSPVSTTVITVPAGARVGALYQHVIGGAQFSGDPDNPIAASHKGPMTAYLAKVNLLPDLVKGTMANLLGWQCRNCLCLWQRMVQGR